MLCALVLQSAVKADHEDNEGFANVMQGQRRSSDSISGVCLEEAAVAFSRLWYEV